MRTSQSTLRNNRAAPINGLSEPTQTGGWSHVDARKATWVSPLGWCHGWHVNKKAPCLDAFKWQLRCQYWIKWSETWQRHPSKWQLHFNILKLGTQGFLFEWRPLETFQRKATSHVSPPVFVDSRQCMPWNEASHWLIAPAVLECPFRYN